MRKLTENEVIRLGTQLERRQWYQAVMKATRELYQGNFDMVILMMDEGNVEGISVYFDDARVAAGDWEWVDEHDIRYMPACEWGGSSEMVYYPYEDILVEWEEVYVQNDNERFEEHIPLTDSSVLPDDPLSSFFQGDLT